MRSIWRFEAIPFVSCVKCGERLFLPETSVRCLECQQTVPMGIEIVTVKKIGGTRQVIRDECYCRGHGFDYETKAQSARIRPHVHSETLRRFDNPIRGTI